MLQRWCELIMLSATTQESSDSMAASMAMVKPLASSSRNSSVLSWGMWSSGRTLLMVYRSPMAFTFMPSRFTMPMPTKMAMSELGIFWLNLGHTNRTTRHTTPTSTASVLMVVMFCMMASTLSVVSTVGVPAG